MTNLPAIRFRGNEPDPRTMPPGTEWWTDSPHLLTARLNLAVRRGEIVRLTPCYWLNPGLRGVLVHRLKPRPPEWRKPAIVAGAVTVAIVIVGSAATMTLQTIWQGRSILAGAFLACAGTWCLVRVLAGHKPQCPGIHCPGCRR